MAMRIVRAGFPLRVWARRPEVLEAYVAAGATTARSLGELGAACDRVAVCVTTDADIRAVVLADDGLLPAMCPGSSLAVHSTAHPDLVREVEAAANERGVAVLDAPVSGGNAGATAGTMAVLVGGDQAVLDRWVPVMKSYAQTIELLGPVGSGQITKLINNALSVANFGASLHAAATAEQLGLDPMAVLRCLQQSSADSFMLRLIATLDDTSTSLAAARYRKDVDLFHDLTRDGTTRDGALLAATAEQAVHYLEELATGNDGG